MTDAADRRPVFVVGAPRSGTTLVYSLLLSSGDFPLYEGGETLLLQCRSRYGPLRVDAFYRRFMRDWIASDQFQRSGLPADAFRRQAEEHRGDYVEFMRFFMEEMCRSQGKARWAEKTPDNIYYLERLAREFPTAVFVHVVRDGRDVALSRRKLGWHVVWSEDPERQLLGAVKHWEQHVQTGRDAGAGLGGRYLEVHYEDLVRCPEEQIHRLAAFTGAEIPVRAEAGRRVGALKGGFSAFGDRVEGISSRPVERWRSRLSARERTVVAVAVGRTLEEFGYPVDGTAGVDGALRRAVVWRTAAYGGLLSLRRWLREHTLLRTLRPPRLLNFDGKAV